MNIEGSLGRTAINICRFVWASVANILVFVGRFALGTRGVRRELRLVKLRGLSAGYRGAADAGGLIFRQFWTPGVFSFGALWSLQGPQEA